MDLRVSLSLGQFGLIRAALARSKTALIQTAQRDATNHALREIKKELQQLRAATLKSQEKAQATWAQIAGNSAIQSPPRSPFYRIGAIVPENSHQLILRFNSLSDKEQIKTKTNLDILHSL